MSNIKRINIKNCCGGSGSVSLMTNSPIKKQHSEHFANIGWTVPPHYQNNGIFYVRKDSLTATASMGTSKISVKVGAYRKEEQIAEFIAILESILV